MLFSQDRVADFINQSFEPAWESVRPVPIVRIDFGNGNVLTRTLHGNILTSICTPDGLVVDGLPGIYTESAYVDRLDQLRLLALAAQSRPANRRDAAVRAYHRRQAAALAKGQDPARVAVDLASLPVTKAVIEMPLETVFTLLALKSDKPVPPPENKSVLADKLDASRWKSLEEDTRLNERTRRRQIHELLAGTGLVRPDKVMRPIYKDVLHADLDDPYLGLGEVLFASYPFAKEDAVH